MENKRKIYYFWRQRRAGRACFFALSLPLSPPSITTTTVPAAAHPPDPFAQDAAGESGPRRRSHPPPPHPTHFNFDTHAFCTPAPAHTYIAPYLVLIPGTWDWSAFPRLRRIHHCKYIVVRRRAPLPSATCMYPPTDQIQYCTRLIHEMRFF